MQKIFEKKFSPPSFPYDFIALFSNDRRNSLHWIMDELDKIACIEGEFPKQIVFPAQILLICSFVAKVTIHKKFDVLCMCLTKDAIMLNANTAFRCQP